MAELEKLSGECGFGSMQTKEVVKSLVDEGKVNNDKVGSQSLFWSLESDDFVGRLREYEANKKRRIQIESEVEALERRLEEERAARSADDREPLLARLTALQAQASTVEAEATAMQWSDPVFMAEKLKKLEEAWDASVRWGDNLCLLVSWLKSNFGLETGQVEQVIGEPLPDYEPRSATLKALTQARGNIFGL